MGHVLVSEVNVMLFKHSEWKFISVVDYITYQLIFGDVILLLTIVWYSDGYGVSSVIHFPIFILINTYFINHEKATEENYQCVFLKTSQLFFKHILLFAFLQIFYLLLF